MKNHITLGAVTHTHTHTHTHTCILLNKELKQQAMRSSFIKDIKKDRKIILK